VPSRLAAGLADQATAVVSERSYPSVQPPTSIALSPLDKFVHYL
jgi:hypothetical protein